jgi:hypothetical protein
MGSNDCSARMMGRPMIKKRPDHSAPWSVESQDAVSAEAAVGCRGNPHHAASTRSSNGKRPAGESERFGTPRRPISFGVPAFVTCSGPAPFLGEMRDNTVRKNSHHPLSRIKVRLGRRRPRPSLLCLRDRRRDAWRVGDPDAHLGGRGKGVRAPSARRTSLERCEPGPRSAVRTGPGS